MKLMGFCLAASLPVLALAEPVAPVLDERVLREECSAFSQAGMRDCLAEKAESSQVKLRQAEKKAVDILTKWDEDSRYITQAKAKLAASNKAFVRYRKAQCEFAASLGGGAIGNALDMGRLACITELNNRRAEQLHNAVSDIPLK
jgi:uncharacterized protein YecT (DUF1311 family)